MPNFMFPVRVVLWRRKTPRLLIADPAVADAAAKISDGLFRALAPEHPALAIEMLGVILPLAWKPRDLHGAVRKLLMERLGLEAQGWEIKSVSPPDDGTIAEARIRYDLMVSIAARSSGEPKPERATVEEKP